MKVRPVLDDAQKSVNTGAVSDILMSEIVADTAAELHRQQTENIIDRQSAFIRDAPSVETLLHRLRVMEEEQNAIRHRWTSVAYEDESDLRIKVGPSFGQPSRSESQETAVVGNEILFTKVAGKGNFGRAAGELGNSERVSNMVQSQCKPEAVRLHLSREAVDAIESNVEQFKEFLQKRSHDTESRFNPWTAVEHIADDILESCVNDVVRELEQINSDIVDHIYNAEFSVAQ